MNRISKKRYIELFLWFVVGAVSLTYAVFNGGLLIYATFFPAIVVFVSYISTKNAIGDFSTIESRKEELCIYGKHYLANNILVSLSVPIVFLVLAMIGQNSSFILKMVNSHEHTIDILFNQLFADFKSVKIDPKDTYDASKVLVIDTLFISWVSFFLFSLPVIIFFSKVAVKVNPPVVSESEDIRKIKWYLFGTVILGLLGFFLITGNEIFTGISFYDYDGYKLRKRLFIIPFCPAAFFILFEYFFSYYFIYTRLKGDMNND